MVGRAWVPLMIAGCGTMQLPDAASQVFSRAQTCPADRVAIKARPDLVPTTVLPPPAMSPAPAEIAADPARLKMWRAQHDTAPDFARLHAEVFEADGCGHQTLYVCAHPMIDGGDGVWSAAWDGNAATVYTYSAASIPHETAVDGDVLSSTAVCIAGSYVSASSRATSSSTVIGSAAQARIRPAADVSE